MSTYTTESIAKGIAQVQDFVISEEPMARLVFRAQIHLGGVKGRLIRQRRVSKDDIWRDDTRIDIRTLEKGDTFNVELKTEAVAKLYQVITELKAHIETNGIDHGRNNYKTIKADDVTVSGRNISQVIQQIIDGKYSGEVLAAFAKSDAIDLTTFADAERVRVQRKSIAALLSRLDGELAYPEVKGDDSWQKFILNNNWMFGATYLDPLDRMKINIQGSMPDFLYPTADGFADVLEIKLPTDEVIVEDERHIGSWKWSPESNTAIGQVTNYIVDIDRLRNEIEKAIKVNTNRNVLLLRPRAYILTGDSKKWLPAKKEALRRLNSILHSIEVITYRDLYLRAQRIVEA